MRGMKRADLRGALAALRAISSNSGIGYREEKGIGQTLRPANLPCKRGLIVLANVEDCTSSGISPWVS